MRGRTRAVRTPSTPGPVALAFWSVLGAACRPSSRLAATKRGGGTGDNEAGEDVQGQEGGEAGVSEGDGASGFVGAVVLLGL